MYATGSIRGSATADELMALDQSHMIPMVFEWIKGFTTGNGNTLSNVLYYQSCAGEY